MTNYDIIKIVNLAVNKDINGNAFSPSEYEVMINSHSMGLFMEYLGYTREYHVNVPIGREGVSKHKINEHALLPFLRVESKSVTGGQLNLSGDNVAYISTVLPATMTGRGFDEVAPYELGDRLGDPVVRPTNDDPIILWRSPVEMLIYPTTISQVVVYYYEYPRKAVVSISTDPVTLLPVYNTSGSTELEWDDLNMKEIAWRIIREAGLNLERGDAVQLADKVIESGR